MKKQNQYSQIKVETSLLDRIKKLATKEQRKIQVVTARLLNDALKLEEAK